MNKTLYTDTYYGYPPIEIFEDGTIHLVTHEFDYNEQQDQPTYFETNVEELKQIVEHYEMVTASPHQVVDRTIHQIDIWDDGDICFLKERVCPIAGPYKLIYSSDIEQVKKLIDFMSSSE